MLLAAADKGLGRPFFLRRTAFFRENWTARPEQAAVRELRTVRLDTHEVLTEAIGMYRSNGYREIPPYNDNPQPGRSAAGRLPC